MEKAQLVFVPASGMGHLVSALEVAKLLLTRCHQLSITVLVLNHSSVSSKVHNYVELQKASSSTISNRLRFIDLPKDETKLFNFSSFIERQKPHVKEAGLKITQSESSVDSPQLKIRDEENFNPIEFRGSTAELPVPTLVNPFPARIMPSAMLSKEWLPPILDNTRRFVEAKGIIVNTFLELESHAIESLKCLLFTLLDPFWMWGWMKETLTKKSCNGLMISLLHLCCSFLCFGSNEGLMRIK
ncbi:anthocyanidin 3-O-glucosyltransferase 1-like [Hevea brasiliensis]|uniref:anthocyanidin 3-O-glucosyltransferase 1-like n=1 Tax=Hevea brasiliensis TaxID=3981 RepID=UPI0025F333AA|nr:anthocyanidin 3-O-glucosyltransferase 1-like [Hevea brasiliensis]XP_058006596.1 anthocyanidin 3-O-glucosyltransferase 1-like [Hevea brasiliensis]